MTGNPRIWRWDVQGLRAVAVLGVLVFHAGGSWLSGGFAGVDVFFVISGFLITGNLVREHRTTGRIGVRRFVQGRIIRLAPAAIATVLVTTVVATLVLPPLDRTSLRVDAIAALLGVENLWLARTGTDYLADHAAGPFQQFWSLGVEEQFYLCWVLVLAAALAVLPSRRLLPVVISLILAVSAVTLVVVSAENTSWSFFAMPTRAWEFCAGALVALLSEAAADRPRTPRSPRPIRRWIVAAAPLVGLSLVAGSFVLLTPDTAYPGVWTVAPVLGATLLVIPGPSNNPIRRVMGARPLRWIGDRSYSIYLWHWPIMTIPALALDRAPTPIENIGAVAISMLVGWASHEVLETRVRVRPRPDRDRRRARRDVTRMIRARALLIVGSTLIVAGVCAVVTVVPPLHVDTVVATPTRAELLAPAAIGAGERAASRVPSTISPTLETASDDLSPLYGNGCHAGFSETTTRACAFGHGSRTVVLFGDSHAAQWFTPLRGWADDRGMRLVTMTKSSCPSADTATQLVELGREYRECAAWRTDAFGRIRDLRPAVVVLGNAGYLDRMVPHDTDRTAEQWQSALERTIAHVRATGAVSIALHDTPTWTTTPNRALSAALDDVASVSAERTALLDRTARAALAAATTSTGSSALDPVDWLCSTHCSPVLWNVLVYRDSNHITDTMARTLTPVLGAHLDQIVTGGSR